jgi:hypothetical protein
MGGWMYRSTFSWPWHCWRWVVSFTPLPLYTRKKPPAIIGYDTGWAPEPVWTKWRKCFTLPGLELWPLRRPARSQSLYRPRYSDVQFYTFTNKYRTAWCGGNALDLYSGGSQLESRPGDWLCWLRFLVASSVPPGKCCDSTFKQVPTASFQILCNSSFIEHPIFRRYTVWATDFVDMKTINK